MKKVFILILCIYLLLPELFSQEKNFVEKIKIPDVIDTLFIDRDINNWSIRAFANYKDNRFQLRNENDKLTYTPNNPSGIGFGIATKKVIVDIAFNLKSKNKENTERFDLQATMMLEHHLFDLAVQSYQGFNMHSSDLDKSIFRNDFVSRAIGLNYMYIFNAQEFSMTAMKTGLSRQKRGAISFGLGGFLFIDNTYADSSFVPNVINQNFNEYAQIKDIFGAGGGVRTGFSATIPFLKYFFLSTSVSSGIGLMYKNIEAETISYKPKNPLVYQLGLNGSLGYNALRFYINLSIGASIISTDLGYDNKAFYSTTNSKLAIGYKLGKN